MKRILMVLGAVMLSLVALFAGSMVYLAWQAYSSGTANRAAAVAAVEELSTDWRVAGKANIHARFAEAAATPEGRAAIEVMSRLGHLERATDKSQTTFEMGTTDGTTATVEFTGTFQHGTAKVTVTLRESDGRMKLLSISTSDVKAPAGTTSGQRI